jgi:prepilin peptidase CpaA
MLSSILMLAFTLVATVTDIRSHKIYNWTTYPGIFCAYAIASIVSFTEGDPQMAKLFGQIGLGDAALGMFACGGMLLVCYVFFRIGGGDVKLLAMLGAFLGIEQGIEVLLWTLVLGGAMALVMIVWKTGPGTLWRRLGCYLKALIRLRGFAHLRGDEPHASATLFLAPSALVALIFVRLGLLRYVGLY